MYNTKQLNEIYRFVTMVYQYNYHNSGHLLFKAQRFGFCLRLRVAATQFGPIDRASLCLRMETECSLHNVVF
jgi:hypothetical protein